MAYAINWRFEIEGAGSGAIAPGFLQQGLDVRPQGLPGGTFLLGEFRQPGLVAQAGEVGIVLPVLQRLRAPRRDFGLAAVERPGPGGQLVLEPAEGLAAELGPRGLIGRRIVLPLTAAGQRGGAGGVVAVLGLAIVGQLGVGLERLGEEPGRGGVELASRSRSGRR